MGFPSQVAKTLSPDAHIRQDLALVGKEGGLRVTNLVFLTTTDAGGHILEPE